MTRHEQFKHRVRCDRIMKFMSDLPQPSAVLDLGAGDSYVRSRIRDKYWVIDLDCDLNRCYVGKPKVDAITSFEVFEHLYNLYPLLVDLKHIGVPMYCTVPYRFPLTKQYWSEDKYDRHYNEFEKNQFFWILKEAGWKIDRYEDIYLPFNLYGLRPFLRSFISPTWLMVKAVPYE